MTRFLQQAYARRYGGAIERAIGPFGPGLNVVYGPNEAGKSTYASMIGGVLFGWEDAHGVRNRYLPSQGGRCGRLTWADAQERQDANDDGGEARESAADAPRVEAFLERDEAALRGDTSILRDIDAETYRAIFSFTTDELRSLGGSSNVTARLLTAAAGTASSPASAFTEIEWRTTQAVREILDLNSQLESARNEVKRLTDQELLLKQEDQELRELQLARPATSARIDELNDEIEDLVSWRAELESIEAQIGECRRERDALVAERDEAISQSAATPDLNTRLVTMDSSTERKLRDRLDELADVQNKADRMLDMAKENSASSSAAYEALVEIGGRDENAADRKGSTLKDALSPPASLSVLLTILFIVAGVPLFIHGRQVNSLSFTALGAGLIVSAAIIAVASVAMIMRPPKGREAAESRRKDAQWVMLQDRKKLEACEAERNQVKRDIEAFLAEWGLGEANGSIRQARLILDEAREQRGALAVNEQRASSLESRIRSAERQLDALQASRDDVEGKVRESTRGAQEGSVSGAVELRELDAFARSKTAQRDALVETLGSMSERMGELSSKLAQAKRDDSFALAKFEYHQVRARLRARKNDLIELLLAKRMVERSIAAWENQSQPEVYAQASRLLSIITSGQWVGVSTSDTGSLVAIDATGVERDPRHLSLGTCQQLYLALRIALLEIASDVGREVPVLADDILVNFDACRREGAARALAELARMRQVIVFTCHEETAAALSAADPTLTRITL